MKRNHIISIDNLITLLMPILLMSMTITHSIVFLYIIFTLGILRINKPFVIFPVYFIASLSTGWFAIEEGLSAGRYLSILMILSLLIDWSSRKTTSIQVRDITLVAVFLVYCMLSSLLSITGEFASFFMMLQSLAVWVLFMLRNNDDASKLFNILFYSAIIVIVGVSIRTFSEGITAFIDERYGNDLAQGVNSNRIAMMLAQIGAIFGVNILNYGLKPRGIISIAGLLMSAFIVVLTGSRTGLIAVIAPFIIMALFICRKQVGKYIFPLIILTLVVYLAFNWMVGQNLAGLNRMSVQDVVETGGTERLSAIKIMWKDVFPHYPIFGVGLGGANFIAAAAQYGTDHPCHNIFFDSLCQLGLFGFTIFFAIIFKVYKKTYNTIKLYNNQICVLGFSLLLAATFNGIGETVYLEKLFWNAITICMIGNSFAQTQNRTLSGSNGKI